MGDAGSCDLHLSPDQRLHIGFMRDKDNEDDHQPAVLSGYMLEDETCNTTKGLRDERSAG